MPGDGREQRVVCPIGSLGRSECAADTGVGLALDAHRVCQQAEVHAAKFRPVRTPLAIGGEGDVDALLNIGGRRDAVFLTPPKRGVIDEMANVDARHDERVTPELTPLLTSQDVARFLGITVRSVQSYVASGALPCVHIGPAGRLVRFREQDVRQLIHPNFISRTPDPTEEVNPRAAAG